MSILSQLDLHATLKALLYAMSEADLEEEQEFHLRELVTLISEEIHDTQSIKNS